MAKQNIFDNEVFFEGYKDLRNREKNANNLFEIPQNVLNHRQFTRRRRLFDRAHDRAPS